MAWAASASSLGAADWPQFRGPSNDGSSPETGLPAAGFAGATRWRTPLPGPGASTPAVAGDRVYVSAYDRATGDVVALALDAASGRILWRASCGPGQASDGRGFENHGASPSPAADGDRSYFMAGNGRVFAFDREGRTVWQRDLAREHGPFSISFGYAASPLLHEGTLYVPLLHRGPSRVVALDAATGRDRWSAGRATDAVGESQEAYTAPAPMRHGDGTWILILGGDYLTAHDARTGRVAWRAGYNPARRENWRVVPSPITDGTRVFVNAPQLAPLHAFEPAGDSARAVWTRAGPVTDVPTPALWRGSVILLADRARRLARLDGATGAVAWDIKLDGLNTLRASPLAADGKAYVIDTDGEVRVVALDGPRAGTVVGTASMGGYPCQAGIVAARGHLFVRTGEALHCLGGSER